MNGKRHAAAAALVFVAACGSAGSGISRPAGTRLHTRVAAIQSAAAHGNRDATALRVAQLRSSVQHLRATGQLDSAAAARILRAAQAVQDQLALLPEPTTTTTETTTTTSPDPPSQGKDKHHRKHDGGDG